MEERKLTKEDIDRVRGIEGFPIAKDEDIIALSRPPYYTACPNPFIADFIKEHGAPYDEATDDYHREPFAADVSDDKYDKIYHFHPYHTKVPYRTISKYIKHYTHPKDTVLDAFCGSGMTGVASLLLDDETGEKGRNIILCDLSPAATFISASTINYIMNHDAILSELTSVLNAVAFETEWMYQTKHTSKGFDGNDIGVINSVIWSDVFVCPACNRSFVFWDTCVDISGGKIRSSFNCPHCAAQLKKDDCERYRIEAIDGVTGERIQVAQQVPVQINYSFAGCRYDKKPDAFDLALLDKIERERIPYWVPTDKLPDGDNTSQPQISHGFTRVSQFYTKRNLWTLGAILNKTSDPLLRFIITKVAFRITKRYGLTYMNGSWGAGGGPTNGTLYIPSLIKELPVVKQLQSALTDADKVPHLRGNSEIVITTQSATDLQNIPSNSIDYIFTDPPFGGNLNYSELNYIWESWLRVFTNQNAEAIMNKTQGKALSEYHRLMERCFSEYFRALKPNHWITVEFHNSSNAIWNAIQESLMSVGFIVADVRVLDKGKMSFKQIVSKGSVKSDLIISAYKPKESFIREFTQRAGDTEMAWEFVRQHLQNVPIAPDSTGKIEVVSERQDYLLFDRMVAFHIMNGIPVPMDAHTFYAGLRERFIQRDGMFFLADQVNEYDERRAKMELEKPEQMSLFISDEKSAIVWLIGQLSQQRQSYAEIQPKYLQDLHQAKFELLPELLDMLKENFLQDDDGKWYVPNLSDKADLEKLRRKRLLKDFYDIYAKGTGRIKNARTEAIRVGFDECWKERNYALIVQVGDRLPETVLQEDPALLMYYDNAANRM